MSRNARIASLYGSYPLMRSRNTNLYAGLAARIPDLAQIVAFRNQLIHGYAAVKVSTVWNMTQNALVPLIAVVQTLLDELGGA